jgi:hypothetical protein
LTSVTNWYARFFRSGSLSESVCICVHLWLILHSTAVSGLATGRSTIRFPRPLGKTKQFSRTAEWPLSYRRIRSFNGIFGCERQRSPRREGNCRARRNCADRHGLRREAPRRFRAGHGPQKLAACACGRKRRRRWRFAGALHDAKGIARHVEIARIAMVCGVFVGWKSAFYKDSRGAGGSFLGLTCVDQG